MSRLILLTSLMAAVISAQADHAAPGFKYIGCVEAEAPVFSWDAALPAPFSAQQCQHACHAKGKYAALDGAGCHCDEASAKTDESKYKVLDESVCGIPCVGGNATAGFCGGPECPVTGKKRYSLYKKEKEDDDCEKEHGDKNKGIGTWNKEVPVKTTTAFKTIPSCPPEVTNCPLTAHTKVVEPSSIAKHQTTPMSPSLPARMSSHPSSSRSSAAEAGVSRRELQDKCSDCDCDCDLSPGRMRQACYGSCAFASLAHAWPGSYQGAGDY
ncbi:hypothetical protein J3F83DRAFT_712397 [Trichoderma novae-zelandiae]